MSEAAVAEAVKGGQGFRNRIDEMLDAFRYKTVANGRMSSDNWKK